MVPLKAASLFAKDNVDLDWFILNKQHYNACLASTSHLLLHLSRQAYDYALTVWPKLQLWLGLCRPKVSLTKGVRNIPKSKFVAPSVLSCAGRDSFVTLPTLHRGILLDSTGKVILNGEGMGCFWAERMEQEIGSKIGGGLSAVSSPS